MIRVEHPTDRPNFTEVNGPNWTVWFSYSTPIAFRVGWQKPTVCENVWSKTTGKHLNWINDNHDERLSSEDFDKAFKEFASKISFEYEPEPVKHPSPPRVQI